MRAKTYCFYFAASVNSAYWTWPLCTSKCANKMGGGGNNQDWPRFVTWAINYYLLCTWLDDYTFYETLLKQIRVCAPEKYIFCNGNLLLAWRSAFRMKIHLQSSVWTFKFWTLAEKKSHSLALVTSNLDCPKWCGALVVRQWCFSDALVVHSIDQIMKH
jgi:hypothetical protein